MKNILIVLLVIGMLSLVGCFAVPVEPEPEPEPEIAIVCEGGHYVEHFSDWSPTGCETDPWYAAGTYWINKDGRVFLLGATAYPDEPADVYGKCPESFVEEIK